ncbi:MAG TPA: glycosyltransferase family 4 protein [bacterium]|nr:glycosyltransferase family 4 protein [bacterium]
MNLLVFTRKVDQHDERAGFMSEWLTFLAAHLNKLIVICQEVGDISGLPNNVTVYSLGKESGKSKLYQLVKCQMLIVKCLPKVDGVFVHMIPHYSLLVGPWCKIFHKKLIQWYAHGTVDRWLKLAHFWIDEFVTSSKDGFRLITKKPVHIIGQGINIDKFKNQKPKIKINDKFIILTVGRISPVKNLDILIKVIENIQHTDSVLRDKILLQVIGGPGLPTQATYLKELEQAVTAKNLNNVIDFLGPLPPKEILPYYQNADLFINLSDTGSLDKAVLEAMAAGLLILTANPAYQHIIPQELFLPTKEVNYITQKITELYLLPSDKKNILQNQLTTEVEQNHNLNNFIKKIIALYE